MKIFRIPLTFLFVLFLYITSFSQLIVDRGIYKANFSNTYHEPKYVSYYLYKGGGDCNRDKFSFKNDDVRLECATDQDYKGSHYDKGHLVNAEDFAFDCVKDELTFRYYNCLPQTTNLNRGIWKSKETQIREWSQKRSCTLSVEVYLVIKRLAKSLFHHTVGRSFSLYLPRKFFSVDGLAIQTKQLLKK